MKQDESIGSAASSTRSSESAVAPGGWLISIGAVLIRPILWPTAVRTTWRLRRAQWWSQAPYLPVPAPDYLRFRMLTAYGDPSTPPKPTDLVSFLHWCRAWPVLRP